MRSIGKELHLPRLKVIWKLQQPHISASLKYLKKKTGTFHHIGQTPVRILCIDCDTYQLGAQQESNFMKGLYLGTGGKGKLPRGNVYSEAGDSRPLKEQETAAVCRPGEGTLCRGLLGSRRGL